MFQRFLNSRNLSVLVLVLLTCNLSNAYFCQSFFERFSTFYYRNIKSRILPYRPGKGWATKVNALDLDHFEIKNITKSDDPKIQELRAIERLQTHREFRGPHAFTTKDIQRRIEDSLHDNREQVLTVEKNGKVHAAAYIHTSPDWGTMTIRLIHSGTPEGMVSYIKLIEDCFETARKNPKIYHIQFEAPTGNDADILQARLYDYSREDKNIDGPYREENRRRRELIHLIGTTFHKY